MSYQCTIFCQRANSRVQTRRPRAICQNSCGHLRRPGAGPMQRPLRQRSRVRVRSSCGGACCLRAQGHRAPAEERPPPLPPPLVRWTMPCSRGAVASSLPRRCCPLPTAALQRVFRCQAGRLLTMAPMAQLVPRRRRARCCCPPPTAVPPLPCHCQADRFWEMALAVPLALRPWHASSCRPPLPLAVLLLPYRCCAADRLSLPHLAPSLTCLWQGHRLRWTVLVALQLQCL